MKCRSSATAPSAITMTEIKDGATPLLLMDDWVQTGFDVLSW